MLPLLVALAWLFLSWRLLLGGPGLARLVAMARSQSLAGRWSDFEIFTWFCAMLLAMVAVDRLYCAWVRRRIGVDPMRVHWSRLRNRDGAFFCAQCQSVSLLPPEDFNLEKMVHCADCGHSVASYGEMKPYLEPYARYRFAQMARMLRR